MTANYEKTLRDFIEVVNRALSAEQREDIIRGYALLLSRMPLRHTCHYGTIEASVFSDGGEYQEIAIDLEREDGKHMQVAVIGSTEKDMHVYVWSGNDADWETEGWEHGFNALGDGTWD